MDNNRNDKFQHWLFAMDDQLEEFFEWIPLELKSKLDYSAESLLALEEWVLKEYDSVEATRLSQESVKLDHLARYFGEIARKTLGVKWSVELDDLDNVYYGLPIVTHKMLTPFCPLAMITTTTDRRRGDFLYNAILKRKQKVKG